MTPTLTDLLVFHLWDDLQNGGLFQTGLLQLWET
jgi:hypothetical protein